MVVGNQKSVHVDVLCIFFGVLPVLLSRLNTCESQCRKINAVTKLKPPPFTADVKYTWPTILRDDPHLFLFVVSPWFHQTHMLEMLAWLVRCNLFNNNFKLPANAWVLLRPSGRESLLWCWKCPPVGFGFDGMQKFDVVSNSIEPASSAIEETCIKAVKNLEP